jgi:glyoxylase-like metal-dependent hydrolase (beta-lactamase superfamily II)
VSGKPPVVVGDCRLWVLHDGILWDEPEAVFGRVPSSKWSNLVKPASDNRIALPVQGFLIQSQSELILVDTGFGRKGHVDPSLERADGDLLDDLMSIGFAPTDVTVVVNTHLHSDHAGGNTTRIGGRLEATFPRASYLIQRREWGAAKAPHPLHADLYHPDDFEPLQEAGRVRLLDGAQSITPEIACRPAPGHTLGHQVVLISSRTERFAIVGDLATQRWQLANPSWACPYDLLPALNMGSKQAIRLWLAGGAARVGFAHDDVVTWSGGRSARPFVATSVDGSTP